VVILTVVVAKNESKMSRGTKVQVWVALLSLSALRSPFVTDDYELFTALFMLCFSSLSIWTSALSKVWLGVCWVLMSIIFPWQQIPLEHNLSLLVLSTFIQFLAIGFYLVVCYRGCKGESSFCIDEKEQQENSPKSNADEPSAVAS
jgi:uncharacterized integral membrane protein